MEMIIFRYGEWPDEFPYDLNGYLSMAEILIRSEESLSKIFEKLNNFFTPWGKYYKLANWRKCKGVVKLKKYDIWMNY